MTGFESRPYKKIVKANQVIRVGLCSDRISALLRRDARELAVLLSSQYILRLLISY